MNRLTYVKIAGKEYPMSFSLGATKKIIEKYGSVSKMQSELKKSSEVDKIGMISDLLSLLIYQGCAYKNYFEKDIPDPENAPIVDGKWTPLPADVIDIALGVMDIEEVSKKIEECMSSGSNKGVEIRTEGKNAKGAQE